MSQPKYKLGDIVWVKTDNTNYPEDLTDHNNNNKIYYQLARIQNWYLREKEVSDKSFTIYTVKYCCNTFLLNNVSEMEILRKEDI